VLELFGLSLPAALLALRLGTRINHASPTRTFEGIVYPILGVLGVVMVGQVVLEISAGEAS
jgi:uncharacterized membrane protein YfcA